MKTTRHLIVTVEWVSTLLISYCLLQYGADRMSQLVAAKFIDGNFSRATDFGIGRRFTEIAQSWPVASNAGTPNQFGVRNGRIADPQTETLSNPIKRGKLPAWWAHGTPHLSCPQMAAKPEPPARGGCRIQSLQGVAPAACGQWMPGAWSSALAALTW